MKHKFAIAFISLWILQTSIAADHNTGKTIRAVDELIKRNDLEGAYQVLSFALAGEPLNVKYANKKSEVGGIICNRMVDTVRNLVQADPTSAYTLVQKALTFDPTNPAALHEGKVLEQEAAAAKNALDGAYSAAYDGDAKKAGELLASASQFRNWHWDTKEVGFSFDSVTAELQRLTEALRVKAFVQAGSIDQAMDYFMQPATQTADSTSFAGKSLAESRHEIIKALVYTAKSRPLNVTSFAERARLLANASKLDPTDKDLRTLESDTSVEYLDLLDKLPQKPHFSDPRSAARFHRAVLDATAEVLGSAHANATVTADNAYPALHANLSINDVRSCLSPDDRDRLESNILNTLGPVAVADKAVGSEMTIVISEIDCAKSDIPRSSVQSANSIYVAGKSQLANPA